MAIKTYKPYTPSRRHMTGSDFSEITKKTPEKSLTVSLKKTSGRNDMIFGSFFLEIFQRGQRSFTQLNLIKNNKCTASGNRLTADMRQDRNQISRADAFCKRIC